MDFHRLVWRSIQLGLGLLIFLPHHLTNGEERLPPNCKVQPPSLLQSSGLSLSLSLSLSLTLSLSLSLSRHSDTAYFCWLGFWYCIALVVLLRSSRRNFLFFGQSNPICKSAAFVLPVIYDDYDPCSFFFPPNESIKGCCTTCSFLWPGTASITWELYVFGRDVGVVGVHINFTGWGSSDHAAWWHTHGVMWS